MEAEKGQPYVTELNKQGTDTSRIRTQMFFLTYHLILPSLLCRKKFVFASYHPLILLSGFVIHYSILV